jgi:predicted metal-dependent phosphoesterase TrpH
MSTPLWKIELHSHTIYSKDSLIRLNDLPEICRQQGIDKLAITDHNRAAGALNAYRLFPILIIPGEEIMTTEGELLAWYIREEVPAGLTPEEAIRRLRDQGAVIGVAHPFDRYRKGAWKADSLERIVDLVDAIEVFNARCLHLEDNQKALAFAEQQGKLMTCGSDAHIRREYGKATLLAEPFANTADGLRQALQMAERQESLSDFLVHFGTRYAKWMKRLRPSLKPE